MDIGGIDGEKRVSMQAGGVLGFGIDGREEMSIG
jgi:hypothetical protein